MSKLVQRLISEPDIDFTLIAVTSSLKEYRLCFNVNRDLFVDFARIADLSLETESSPEPVLFSRYYYMRPELETIFFLISNKGTEGYLIPEMKSTDYFILVKNLFDEEELASFIAGLNRISDIVVAAKVDPMKLKSKENLIFYTDEEKKEFYNTDKP